MNIDVPRPGHIPALRQLWQEAFGDTDDFLDGFFAAADPLNHCRCVLADAQPAAALYWFDCVWQKKTVAYLYAVATKKALRGQGLCRALMEDTHAYLKKQGYHGTILVPGSGELRAMYAAMGYQTATSIRNVSCQPGNQETVLRKLQPEVYARLRRQLLPPGSVLQEGRNLDFLKTRCGLFTGEDFLLAAEIADGVVTGELLGNTERAPEIVKAMGCQRGSFRTPGEETAFAMYHPLDGENHDMPGYFGLAFD